MEFEAASSPIRMQGAFASHTPWTIGGNEFSRPSNATGKSLFGPKLSVGVRSEARGCFEKERRKESSPTSLLVADITQNFHIDKTPQVPTPRRSLFPFGPNAQNGRALPTTPVIPSSSPCHENMDLSPLPHKPAFSASLMVPSSPTEARTKNQSRSLSRTMSLCSSPPGPDPISTPTPDIPRMDLTKKLEAPVERKKSSNFTRPSLLKHNSRSTSFKAINAKALSGLSTSSLFGRSPTVSSAKLEDLFASSPRKSPAVSATKLDDLFACSPRKSPAVSSTKLDDLFACSPRKSPTVSSTKLEDMFACSPPPRKQKELNKRELGAPLSLVSSKSKSKGFPKDAGPTKTSLDGSPIAPLHRHKFQRPRGKIRRTLSMFDNPDDLMKRNVRTKGTELSPIKDSPGEKSILPCFTSKEDTLRRIDKATLCKVMDGQYKDEYDELMVVDCRFEYEYEGGHISGAVNVNSTEALENMFFKRPRTEKLLIIFHCEFSAHRAPRMALHLRSRDRQLNMQRYPALYYPDVYILEGGYCSFFNQYRVRCEPEQYVQMKDSSHLQTCEREMAKLQQKRGKISRTQSFTFGAKQVLDGSPSFGKRSSGGCSRDSEGLLSFNSKSRGDPRRMASF
ncbi:uncharacterized protein LAJ45_00142 [Morchella importuna]|uniref:M-phase inducer phosphatase n=1 Tax=Morchella conica CCBAS932 TaxID=1392247 RepID=A0A3N4KDW7_9PEZI|nr:uncharacterized protein LAJ45_00142 [Morchella importuna]KAH8155133.1 hypothetical protein LAJ45_00142 [Morchella importuna]RPB08677.1 hypothetical protein P167DRAFT_578052 [Morchella conica CCBAS932]